MSAQEVLETRRVRIPVVKLPRRPRVRKARRNPANKSWVALAACIPVAVVALIAGLLPLA